jgi:sulfoxide reductase catalytic subunit YedY
MLIRRQRGWELPESEATPEAAFLARRDFVKAIAAGPILAAGLAGSARAAVASDPSAALYPAKRDPRYTLDRSITPAKYSEHYNNFYEFGSEKSIADLAQALPIRPWTIRIDGMVEKPFTIGFDDLLKKVTLEERLYRHRCVEAWAMAVPWTGFPMSAFLDLAKPLSSAKYVRMETFLVTGMYGKPVPKQDGAPLRLVLPWKYGFKSAKSIVRVSFTDARPKTFWSVVVPSEYGFWANVNPAVPHPRWSQASERVLGTDKRVPTQIWNGYGEYVAAMYAGLKNEKLFM